MAELILREARREDSAAAARLIHAVLREYGLRPEPGGTDADLADLEASYRQAGHLFVVLEDGAGEIQGTGALYRLAPAQVEIRKMYFAPRIRGQGWGKALLAWLLEEAGRRGYREVRLETASVLREAIALYRAFGFVPEPGAPGVARCDQAFRLALPDWQRPAGVRRLVLQSS